MAYADWDFYNETYLAGAEGKIPETDFVFCVRKASAVIDSYTFYRIANASDTDDLHFWDEEIGLCACELAEMIYEEKLNSDMVIESTKDGGLYVPNDVTYIGDKVKSGTGTAENASARRLSIIHTYLGCTGLMYRGVG